MRWDRKAAEWQGATGSSNVNPPFFFELILKLQQGLSQLVRIGVKVQ